METPSVACQSQSTVGGHASVPGVGDPAEDLAMGNRPLSLLEPPITAPTPPSRLDAPMVDPMPPGAMDFMLANTDNLIVLEQHSTL